MPLWPASFVVAAPTLESEKPSSAQQNMPRKKEARHEDL